MASAMSVTWNSSKQSSQLSSAISAGGEPDRIVVGDLAVLQLLPEHAHALVHVGHEFVEMRAALADHRARLEEQVHQHGLAAADVAEDVEALGGVVVIAAAEQPADRMASGAPSDARRCAARAPRTAPAVAPAPGRARPSWRRPELRRVRGRTWTGLGRRRAMPERHGLCRAATDRACADARQAIALPGNRRPACQPCKFHALFQCLSAASRQCWRPRHIYAAVQ